MIPSLHSRTQRAAVLLALAALAVLGTACDGTRAPNSKMKASPDVVVVDLDEVAKRLGRDVQISDALKAEEEKLTQQLTAIQDSFRKQLEEKQTALGQKPTEEQQREFLGMQQEANVKLNQASQEARTKLSSYQAKAVAEFLHQARPIALDIARSRGATVVLVNNDSLVLGYEPANDITTEVATRMRATTPPAGEKEKAAPAATAVPSGL